MRVRPLPRRYISRWVKRKRPDYSALFVIRSRVAPALAFRLEVDVDGDDDDKRTPGYVLTRRDVPVHRKLVARQTGRCVIRPSARQAVPDRVTAGGPSGGQAYVQLVGAPCTAQEFRGMRAVVRRAAGTERGSSRQTPREPHASGPKTSKAMRWGRATDAKLLGVS